MVSRRPSGVTRVRVPRRISTNTTEPSAIATGPSGNCNPPITSCICMVVPLVGTSINSAHPALLFKIEFQIIEHPHGGGAAGTEHAAARVLERTYEVEALDAGNGELPEVRRRTMRARLVDRCSNP